MGGGFILGKERSSYTGPLLIQRWEFNNSRLFHETSYTQLLLDASVNTDSEANPIIPFLAVTPDSEVRVGHWQLHFTSCSSCSQIPM